MQEHLMWFAAGAVALCVLLLVRRLARRHRTGIDVTDRGRRYEWARDGEL
jgi:hypothetical protein